MIPFARPHLTILCNALYDLDVSRISVAHPSEEIGELLEIDLGDPQASTVSLRHDDGSYRDARHEVECIHGHPAVDELPEASSYRDAFLAGGLLRPDNAKEIEAFLEQNGYADLTAGHRPVLAGFDTNLMAWRIADVLGLDPGNDPAVNGFALATGVRDELDWDVKQSDTRPLEEAFGPQFDQFWNQPAGARREGRLAENYYRHLRDHRYAEEIPSDTGDDAIVKAYDGFQQDSQKDVILFSNDRDFIEKARLHHVPAQRVEFPASLPGSMEGSWREIQNTLYVLTIVFGVLELPKVTLYGVWKGKSGQAWHDEQLMVECRSPKIEPLLTRDLEILERYADLG